MVSSDGSLCGTHYGSLEDVVTGEGKPMGM